MQSLEAAISDWGFLKEKSSEKKVEGVDITVGIGMMKDMSMKYIQCIINLWDWRLQQDILKDLIRRIESKKDNKDHHQDQEVIINTTATPDMLATADGIDIKINIEINTLINVINIVSYEIYYDN